MSASQTAREILPRFTDRLPLGTSGLSVSPFCLGSVDTPQTVSTAFDAGINFFFITADMHWPYYEELRRGLDDLVRRPGVRDDVVIGACCYPTQPEFCSMPFEEVLQAVPSLKRIDVLIAGGSYSYDFSHRLPVYQENRRSNYVGARAIGTTFHDRKRALQAINEASLDIAYIRYNPDHPGARHDIFPYIEPSPTLLYNFKSTLGFVAPKHLDQIGWNAEYWRPTITDYYRFALSAPQLDGLLIATRTPQQVEALSEALEEGPLSEDEQEALMNIGRIIRGEVEIVH